MAQTLSVRSFLPLPAATLEAEARLHLKAARLWVMLAQHGRSPRPVLAALLGGTAPAFCTLMEQVVAAWPDPFTTFPPCASAVSPDEAALLALLAEGGTAADRLLGDLLAAPERRRLAALAERVSAG